MLNGGGAGSLERTRLPRIPCLTGKKQGIFAESAPNRRFIWSKRLGSQAFLPNSLSNITGNFLSRTGNFWPGTGNLRSLLPGTRRSRAIAHSLGRISGALDIGGQDPAPEGKVPVVFVANNNGWAITVPRAQQTTCATLAQKAVAAGFPGHQVDGNDVIAVCDAVRQALDRARGGHGPSLVEAVILLGADYLTGPKRTGSSTFQMESKQILPRDVSMSRVVFGKPQSHR